MGQEEFSSHDCTLGKERGWDFPGGPVVENPSCNAGDAGSIPGGGTKMPYAAGQLSPHTTTTEPRCSGAHMPQPENLRTATNEPACHN